MSNDAEHGILDRMGATTLIMTDLLSVLRNVTPQRIDSVL